MGKALRVEQSDSAGPGTGDCDACSAAIYRSVLAILPIRRGVFDVSPGRGTALRWRGALRA